MDRPLSVAALRCRTSDRTAGGARGAEALALALDPDARLIGTPGEPRSPPTTTTCATRTAACSKPAVRSTTCSTAGRSRSLTASDCSICMTTFQAVVRHVPDVRVLWLDAHGDFNTPDDDAERVPRRHVPGRGVRALGLRLRAVARARARADVRRARPRRRRARPGSRRAGVGNARPSEVVPALAGEQRLRAPRPRRARPDVLPAQFAVPHGLSDTGLRTLLGEVARECDVVGVEVTAFEAPEDPASAPPDRARRIDRAGAAAVTDGLGDPRRLAALAESGLLDSPPEAAFDRVTRLVAEVLHVPVALFTLVTAERQVFKSSVGVGELRETPLSHSFCRHVVESGAPLEVVDARSHPKVRDNPSIEDYGIVAYLGVPLTTADGVRLGALCAIDHEPRQWTGRDHGVLEDLAGAAMAEVELRRANRAVAAAAAELHFAATHDSLTRLGNRRALLDDLGQLLADERPATFALLRPARHARLQRRARAHRRRRAAGAARRGGWRPRSSATGTCTGSAACSCARC